ncbi:MAG: DUF1566 domain-containing protein, partial [Candidatus Alcyoniella australis]|nr:DUF1566 domain-containing protein [Candidatus Alcyoniella australis]
MKRLMFLALVALLCLGVGLVISCSGGGDDDTGDDDTGDDDTGDDDTGDDDSGDDDTGDDDDGDLTWQNPPSEDSMSWDEAKTYCANLSFDGHDDWRLPTISELRSLIRGCDATETGGACNVTDDCTESDCWNNPCIGCEYGEGPGSGGAYWPDEMTGEIFWYWSSSSVAHYGDRAWAVGFNTGYVGEDGTGNYSGARCVRP